MSAIWSDTPPTEPGWYLVLNRFGDGVEECAQLRQSGLWLWGAVWCLPSELAEEVLFGPRIEPAESLAAQNDLVLAVDRFLSMHASRSKAENEDRLEIRKLIDQVKGDGDA